MKKHKKLQPYAFGIVHSIIFGFIGLFLGFLYSVGGFFYDIYDDNLGEGTALAFIALIGMPMIGIVTGFLFGVFAAVIFNIQLSLRKRLKN